MNEAVRWFLGGVVVVLAGACGSDDDNDRTAADLALASATDAVGLLGLDSAVVVGAPVTQPCLDGVGNPTSARLANYAIELPQGSVSAEQLDRVVAALPEGPLQDSRSPNAERLVVYTERRSGVLITVRLQLERGERAHLGVAVDCVG